MSLRLSAFTSRIGWWSLGPVLLGAVLSAPSCKTHDCSDERLDTARCFGNRVEYCIKTDEGNRLGYENCATKGLICDAGLCIEPPTAAGSGGGGGNQGSGGSANTGGQGGGTGGSSGGASPSGGAGPGVGGMGGSGGAPADAINGCTQGTAVDMTQMSSVTIGADGLKYDPACVRVQAGTTVTMALNFAIHPTKPGTIENGQATIDMTSEIPATTNGTSVVFNVTTPGTLPYFCDSHFINGMYGAIFVE